MDLFAIAKFNPIPVVPMDKKKPCKDEGMGEWSELLGSKQRCPCQPMG